MRKLVFLLLPLLFSSACKKDKLTAFEQTFLGEWTSISYKVGETDRTADLQADLTLSDDGKYNFSYKWQDDAFSYILLFEASGTWKEDETAQKIKLDKPSLWTDLTGSLQGSDSLRLDGTRSGNAVEIVLVRK